MLQDKLLYYYNKAYFLDTDWSILPEDCVCPLTSDKQHLHDAKGVIFHVPSLTQQDLEELPKWHKQRPHGQAWIAYSQESAANFPLLDNRELMQLFDYEASYRQQADIWQPYLDQEVLKAITNTTVQAKTEFCAAFISSPLNLSYRQQLLQKLMEYMPVDSYGRLARSKWLPKDHGNRPYSRQRYQVKLNTISRYRFTLAFENSICEDYVTEKFFHPLMAGSVPVYYGAPNIEEFSPGENAYINASDFKNSKELASYLQSVDDRQFHEWRDKPLRTVFLDKVERSCSKPFDAVCHLLFTDNQIA